MVVDWIYPEQRIIRNCETRIFKAHERYVVNEGQVSGDPSTRLNKSGCGDSVQDPAHLHAPTTIFQLEDAENRFVESACGLDNIVMDIVNGGIDRNTHH